MMKKAFSLTELVIVLAIISILMGTMKVSFQKRKLQAEARRIVECMKIYHAAITMYYWRKGKLPSPPSSINEKYLEDIPALKPYGPTGFKTLRNVGGTGTLKDVVFYNPGSHYFAVYARLYKTASNKVKLEAEIKKQLKEFLSDEQVSALGTASYIDSDGPIIRIKSFEDFYL